MTENAISRLKDRLQELWSWLKNLSLPFWIVLMVASFILLTFAFNLFFSAFLVFSHMPPASWREGVVYVPAPSPDRRTDAEREREGLATIYGGMNVQERSIEITSTAEELQIAFRLVIEKEDAQAELFAENRHGNEPALLSQALFGMIRVNGRLLREGDFRPVQWQVDPEAETMTVTLTAVIPEVNYPVRIDFEKSEADDIQPEIDQLLIDMSDTVLLEMDPLPDQADEEEASIVKQYPDELPGFHVKVDRSWTPARNESSESAGLSRRRFLLRFSSHVGNIPLVSRVLFAITKAMPLLIFFWLARGWLKKAEGSTLASNMKVLRDMVVVLLFFHFIFHVTRGLGDWLEMAPWVRTLEEGLLTFARHLSESFSLQLGRDSWRIQVVIFGILAPALFLLGWEKKPDSSTGRRNGSQAINLFLALLLFLVIFGSILQISAHASDDHACGIALERVFTNQKGIATSEPSSMAPLHALITCGIPAWVWATLLAGSLVSVMWLSLAVLLWAATRKGYSLLAWAATAFLVLNGLYRLYLMRPRSIDDPIPSVLIELVWRTAAVLLGAFLLWSFSRYLYSVYKQLGLKWQPSRRAAFWLFAGMAILALPTRFVFGGASTREWEFVNLVAQLDDLLVPAWVIGILFLLHQDGKSDLKLETETRLFGALALSTLLYSTLARWFYIPITFLLGAVAIQWLLTTGRNWSGIDERFKKMSEIRADLIKHGSLVRILGHGYSEYRKDRFDKLAKGELSPSRFKTALDIWEKDQKTAAHLPRGRLEEKLARYPLAFGPKATAWDNALHGTLWAFLFALPWLIIYAVNFMQATSYSSSYPLIDFSIDLLTILGRWAGIGFVLGYFFPYLRGNSGLEKSLWLALAVIVPTLPLYFIIQDSAAAWQASLFWGLQVLIECILLGLIAFDYHAVYQEGRGFQLLLELHGLRSLSLWGATLVAAIGTALVTLLSSQAVNLVNLTLQTFLPAEFPGTP